MIKTFLIVFSCFAVFMMGVFGFKDNKFRDTPIRLFPDMDEMDRVNSQSPSDLFENGRGSRPLVPGTVVNSSDESLYSLDFGAGRVGYYYTGRFEDFYGKGLPKELKLNEKSAEAFLNRGQERYGIYCAVCHGETGNGEGVTSKYGIVGIANLHAPNYAADQYPEGRLYDVITNGKGNMSGYGYNIPVDDRWAIVAYVRALQNAKSIPSEELSK